MTSSEDKRWRIAERATKRHAVPSFESSRSRAACRRDRIGVEGVNVAGWWSRNAQLDLVAKGALVREPTTPLRWHRDPAR
jgi:hypothetical protein